MTQKLKVLGVVLGVVFAVGAAGASVASATIIDKGQDTGLFTASVGANEVAKFHLEQTAEGKDTLTLNGLTFTCKTVRWTGTAVETDGSVPPKIVGDQKGPSTRDITFGELTYEGCHVVIAGITKTVTFTTNECGFVFDAKTTTTEDDVTHVVTFDRVATTTLECPTGKQIEIHVYEEKEAELKTLCTYDIGPQDVGVIPLDNKVNTPTSVNDMIATPNVSVAVTNTKLSVLCGQNANTTAVYKGEDTVRATNIESMFVDSSISDFL